VKLRIRVFCENFNAGKAKCKKFYLLTSILLRCNFLTLKSRYDKFNQENIYQTFSESASFCERYNKNIWCVFGSQF